MFRIGLKLLIFLFVFLFIGFWIVSLRMGGVVPGDYVDSKVLIGESGVEGWRTYDANDQLTYAYALFQRDDLRGAEKVARRALKIDPTNGSVVGLLIELHVARGDIKTADYLFGLGSRLWPARYKEALQQMSGNK